MDGHWMDKHTLIHIYGQFSIVFSLTGVVLGGGRQPENSERNSHEHRKVKDDGQS